jgi:hypothetical protein
MLSRIPLVLAWLLAAVAAVGGAPLRLVGLAVEDPPTRAVVEKPTLVRALAPVRFASTLETTEWLLDHPPLAAALARHLHPPLERYHLKAAGAGRYEVDDQGALRGTLRLVAVAPARRVYVCEGQFRSLAHLLTLNGTMVFTLEYRQVRDGGQPLVEVAPQLYLRLDNVLAHGLVKVLGPLLHGVIDRRVTSLTAATLVVGEHITRDAAGLYREMAAWSDLQPGDLAAFRAAFLGDRTS